MSSELIVLLSLYVAISVVIGRHFAAKETDDVSAAGVGLLFAACWPVKLFVEAVWFCLTRIFKPKAVR